MPLPTLPSFAYSWASSLPVVPKSTNLNHHKLQPMPHCYYQSHRGQCLWALLVVLGAVAHYASAVTPTTGPGPWAASSPQLQRVAVGPPRRRNVEAGVTLATAAVMRALAMAETSRAESPGLPSPAPIPPARLLVVRVGILDRSGKPAFAPQCDEATLKVSRCDRGMTVCSTVALATSHQQRRRRPDVC